MRTSALILSLSIIGCSGGSHFIPPAGADMSGGGHPGGGADMSQQSVPDMTEVPPDMSITPPDMSNPFHGTQICINIYDKCYLDQNNPCIDQMNQLDQAC